MQHVSGRASPSGLRVVLVGIDGATYTVLDPLVRDGRTPTFERLLAEEDVRLEFLGVPGDDGESVPRTTGRGDRLDYIPGEDVLWLYGDEQRAEIQRGGDQAGMSRGKVLTYRLDDGTLSTALKARRPV